VPESKTSNNNNPRRSNRSQIASISKLLTIRADSSARAGATGRWRPCHRPALY